MASKLTNSTLTFVEFDTQSCANDARIPRYGLLKSVFQSCLNLIVFAIVLAVSFLYLPKIPTHDTIFRITAPSAFGYSQTSVLVDELDPHSELRPLSWPADAMPIEYSINNSTADGLNIPPSGERQNTNTIILPGTNPVQVIRDAFQAWEDTPTSFVSFTEGAQTSIGTAGLDGTNIVSFIDTSFDFEGDIIRSTSVVFFQRSTGTILESDIIFNPDTTFSGLPKGNVANDNAYNLQFHAIHEVGHFIGVGHVSSPDFLMYPFSVEMHDGGLARRQPIYLDQDCVAACSAIYPEHEFGLTTGRIVGTITRTGNVPIFGAEVVAVDSKGRPLVSAITRRDGTYDMRGVPAGSYELYVQAIDDPVQRELIEFALPATFSPPFPTANFVGGPFTVEAGGPTIIADATVLSSSQGINLNASGRSGSAGLSFFTPLAEQGENFDLIVAGTSGSTIGTLSTIDVTGSDVTLGAPTFFTTIDGRPALRAHASVDPNAVLGPVDISVTTGVETSTLTGGLRIVTPPNAGSVTNLDDDGPLDFEDVPVGLSETGVITVFNNGNVVDTLSPVLTDDGGGQFELLFPPPGSVIPPITALGILVKYTPSGAQPGGGDVQYDSTIVPVVGTGGALEAFIRVDKFKVVFKGPGRDIIKIKGLINARRDNFDFNQPLTIQVDNFSTPPLTPLQVKAGQSGDKVFFKDNNIKVNMKLFKKGSSSGKFMITLKNQTLDANINNPPALNTVRLINGPFNRTASFASSRVSSGLSFNSRKNITATGPFSLAKFSINRTPQGDKFAIKKGILAGSAYGGPILPDDITLMINEFSDVVRGDDLIVSPNGKTIKYNAKRNGITSIKISLPSRTITIKGSGVNIGTLASPVAALRIKLGVGQNFSSEITLDTAARGKSWKY